MNSYIEIKLEFKSLTGKATLYFIKGEKIVFDETEKISARIKLEMMISLYFPEFRQEWEALENTLNSSEDELMRYILTLVASRNSHEVEKVPSETFKKRLMSPEALVFGQLADNADQKVIEFQQAIIKTIQA